MHVFLYILQLKEIKMSRKPISAKKIGISEFTFQTAQPFPGGYNMGAYNKYAVQFYRPDGKLLTSKVLLFVTF